MVVSSELPKRALIGGEWIDGGGGDTLQTRSPWSNEIVNELACCGPEDVDSAVEAARAAQPEWAAVPLLDKVDLLYRIAALVDERREEIARTISLEVGKTIRTTRQELEEFVAPSYRRAAEDLLRHRGALLPSTQERSNDKRLVVTRRPLGVIGLITPYNFPVDIASISIGYALAAGDTVVWKPSEYAPTSCAMLAEILADAGLPPGAVNLLIGRGDVGQAMVEHPGIAGISFTGSTPTGIAITQRAGLKRLLLELGGNGPQIVLADADLDRAVDGAMQGCWYLSGQCCTAAETLLVDDSVHDAFVEKLRSRTAELTCGDPLDEETDVGPLCNEGTLRLVTSHVEDARAKGAEITTFGEPDGLFYPPTILTGVTQEMTIANEETFGPVAPILSFRDTREAIEIANGTGFGLNASVYTESLSDAWRVGEALEHGTVLINESTNYWDQLAPFGGAKQSGVGRELSTWALDAFSEPKLLVFDLGHE